MFGNSGSSVQLVGIAIHELRRPPGSRLSSLHYSEEPPQSSPPLHTNLSVEGRSTLSSQCTACPLQVSYVSRISLNSAGCLPTVGIEKCENNGLATYSGDFCIRPLGTSVHKALHKKTIFHCSVSQHTTLCCLPGRQGCQDFQEDNTKREGVCLLICRAHHEFGCHVTWRANNNACSSMARLASQSIDLVFCQAKICKARIAPGIVKQDVRTLYVAVHHLLPVQECNRSNHVPQSGASACPPHVGYGLPQSATFHQRHNN
mmetsp:Transcript_77329/g.140613  ORF Transcript_77329/g.140613 Transcript_77329/m.140613 type:complete len:260 (+) Transcript_77329:38-817(+)